MQIIRKIVGAIILFFNWVFTPSGIKRDPQSQEKINVQTDKLALYQFNACPFCVKVRRQMKRLSLNIELRDAKNNETYRNELLENGGKVKVPCLKIVTDDGEIIWMYESSDINAYLEKQFS